MKLSFLKPIRLIVALIIFLLVLIYFVDGYSLLPTSFTSWTADIQFIPILLKALEGGIWAIAILLIISVLTLLFGRVYCSTLCPLGTYQDMIIRIKKWTIKKTRFKFKKGSRLIHYSLTALIIIALFFGITSLVIIFDPYSNFGRMAADTFRPPFLKSMSFLAHGLHNLNIYGLNPVNYSVLTSAIIYGLVFTLFITILSWRRGRLFCNLLCPAGGILSIISRNSIFKLRIDDNSCTSCGKCMHICKAECISIKDNTIDFSRCVSCYNCIPVCKSNSIHFQSLQLQKNQSETTSEVSGKRRKLIGETLGMGLGLLAIPALAQKKAPKTYDGEGEHAGKKDPYYNRGIVTPPGSYSLQHFNENCTACHLCVAKCPSNVLQPTFTEYGLSFMLQPKMHYDSSYCNFNCSFCSSICPTGAIKPLTIEEKQVCQIGKVHFSINHCVVKTDGTSCGSCSEHCPTQAVYMVPYGDNLTIPEIKPEICIGCGACEYACPVLVPHKAIFVESNEVHQVADKPKEEEIDFDVNEEFPF